MKALSLIVMLFAAACGTQAGPAGPQGPAGEKGPDGEPGIRGVQGPTGDRFERKIECIYTANVNNSTTWNIHYQQVVNTNGDVMIFASVEDGAREIGAARLLMKSEMGLETTPDSWWSSQVSITDDAYWQPGQSSWKGTWVMGYHLFKRQLFLRYESQNAGQAQNFGVIETCTDAGAP